MRDSCIFYKSFLVSIRLLPKKYQLAFYDALFDYALNDVSPEHLTGGAAALFNALKPQIDANTRKYENGCRGGRPKGNQTETKPKPNKNQTVSKPERNDNVNDNDNDNVNDNDNDNALGLSGGGRYKCDDEFNIWKRLTPDDIDKVFDKYPESGNDLIQAVYEDVRDKRKEVKNPVSYILGYAKNVEWDDNADHFTAPWEAM